jgi:excisionase family DNA binding protein
MPNAWLDLPGFREAVAHVVSDSGNADDGWLDSAQAADYLDVSRARLHNLVSAGRLPRHGPKGHALRFRRAELDAYVEGRR